MYGLLNDMQVISFIGTHAATGSMQLGSEFKSYTPCVIGFERMLFRGFFSRIKEIQSRGKIFVMITLVSMVHVIQAVLPTKCCVCLLFICFFLFRQIVSLISVWSPITVGGIIAATLSSALASLVAAPKVFQVRNRTWCQWQQSLA